MKILVLDDNHRRLNKFRQKFIGHIVECVETAPMAIRYLSETLYDQVYLDHDLDGKVMLESGPGTGWEVAKWLEEHPDRKPKAIFIHSFNPLGSENMNKVLPEAIRVPGIWDMDVMPVNSMWPEEYN